MNPHWSPLIGQLDPDPDPAQEGKSYPENRKNWRNFMFEVLDVHFRELEAAPVAWTSFMDA